VYRKRNRVKSLKTEGDIQFTRKIRKWGITSSFLPFQWTNPLEGWWNMSTWMSPLLRMEGPQYFHELNHVVSNKLNVRHGGGLCVGHRVLIRSGCPWYRWMRIFNGFPGVVVANESDKNWRRNSQNTPSEYKLAGTIAPDTAILIRSGRILYRSIGIVHIFQGVVQRSRSDKNWRRNSKNTPSEYAIAPIWTCDQSASWIR